jgi:hypothetical protein
MEMFPMYDFNQILGPKPKTPATGGGFSSMQANIQVSHQQGYNN